jgi:DNA-binding HxlR family transcriptional regulator
MHDTEPDLDAMGEAVRRIGDRWTLLILWAALQGVTRFDTFQKKLGVARNILSNRLARLVDDGIMEKRPLRDGARRQEYRLTPRGESLRPILARIDAWGAETYPPNERERAPAAQC